LFEKTHNILNKIIPASNIPVTKVKKIFFKI
jgi:hypothetical protein